MGQGWWQCQWCWPWLWRWKDDNDIMMVLMGILVHVVVMVVVVKMMIVMASDMWKLRLRSYSVYEVNSSFIWISIQNEAASEVAVVCPGGEGQCPSDHSCCSAPDGDQFHCCPSGYSCDEGVCQETKLDYPAAVLTPLTKKVVKCNQKFACPDRYTSLCHTCKLVDFRKQLRRACIEVPQYFLPILGGVQLHHDENE